MDGDPENKDRRKFEIMSGGLEMVLITYTNNKFLLHCLLLYKTD